MRICLRDIYWAILLIWNYSGLRTGGSIMRTVLGPLRAVKCFPVFSVGPLGITSALYVWPYLVSIQFHRIRCHSAYMSHSDVTVHISTLLLCTRGNDLRRLHLWSETTHRKTILAPGFLEMGFTKGCSRGQLSIDVYVHTTTPQETLPQHENPPVRGKTRQDFANPDLSFRNELLLYDSYPRPV